MAWSTLPFRRPKTPRALERPDVEAAFMHTARQRWGSTVPVRVRAWRRGSLVLETSSAPWRAEMLLSAEEIRRAVNERLAPDAPIERVLVVLR